MDIKMKAVMNNLYFKTLLVFCSIGVLFTACEDNIDPLVEEIELGRVLSPHGLQAFIRNETTIELNWTVRDEVDHYIVEFSEDSLEFTSIIRTLTVQSDELPVQEKFFGDTRYSARVKGVSASGVADSKWSAITIRTLSENIFLPFNPVTDVGITEATVKWPAGEQATRFIINPGNIERQISAGEIAAGEATITDLDDYTEYTVTMLAGNSQRGRLELKTLLDPDCATCVKLSPGADIAAAISGAAPGSIIVLASGTYSEQGSLAIDKSITIQGAVYYEKPVVYGQITCSTVVPLIAVKDISWRGDAASPISQFFNTVSGCELTQLSIDGCEISNYVNNFIYNNASGIFGSIDISNSYVHSIPGGGGDGIDFRGGAIGSLTVENTTFANGFRTFLRMQAQCATVLKNCTFYAVANNDNGNNHGLFRSSGGGTFETSNCLFVETGVSGNPTGTRGNFCRQASNMVESPVYANNNIFNCYNIFTGLYTDASQVSASELDPGFVDALSGDFTVTNQTLIDRNVGDPRWLQ
jgi:hypothetical protein